MRLIDADYLKQKFCTHCEGYADCSATDIDNRECYDFVLIDHTPTIEAIPLSFIREEIERLDKCKLTDTAEYLRNVLKYYDAVERGEETW